MELFMKMTRKTLLVLFAIYASYFVYAMDTGAYAVAWPVMMEDLNLRLEWAGITFIVQMVSYTLTSMLLGRFAKFARLETINLIGCVLMALGFFGFSLAPNFLVFLIMLTPIGIGMGMMDSSLNTYMAKHFSTRYMNWMHCFFGLGAAISPFLMTRAAAVSGWRLGYLSIGTLQTMVAILVIITVVKGAWVREEIAEEEAEAPVEAGTEPSKVGRSYLSKKRHQWMEVLICFLYGGVEYSMGFWMTSILIESRGIGIEFAGLFPAVYYGAMMVGRMGFGYIANKVRDITMIRVGFVTAFVGVVFLFASGNIVAMALVGLGFAPIFPCLMHDTANRFRPKILTKLVGYEVAAFGAGVAIISSVIGQVMADFSLEALFPIVLVILVLVFLMNEWLEKIAKSKMVS
jgi:fucose permease